MRIAYAIASTSEQNLDFQVDTLKNTECAMIFPEKISGKYKEHKTSHQLIVWKGDVFIKSV